MKIATVLLSMLCMAYSAILDFEQLGAIADDNSTETVASNCLLLNSTLNSLQPGDTFTVSNKTFHLIGGIDATGLKDVKIVLDGTLSFTSDRASWPKDESGHVKECITLRNIENVVFTSSGLGTIDGNGQAWWGAINYLKHQEDRPRLFHIIVSKNIVVEYWLFKDSPFWTFWAEQCDGLIVRYSSVDVRWTQLEKHTLIDMQAFNTDGFDVTGRNVHMHDLTIWNDDDCIAVKDGSEDMLFERITASGLGLVIGSIGSSKVNNITFRDAKMYNTFKGIYLKTRWNDNAPIGEAASISNILYENIVMESPQQWAIWIGAAQQVGQPCQITWPHTERSECIVSGYQTWTNITLRNIYINNPKGSPGVLTGNSTNPMKNVVFDNVVVRNPGAKPWGDAFYECRDIEGIATGGTWPVPPCFTVKNN